MSKQLTKDEVYALNSSASNENSKFALTTVDNPFDPFTQFSDWYRFDMLKGYNTCAYLARISMMSDNLSESENNDEKERAIDEILKYDFLMLLKKSL